MLQLPFDGPEDAVADPYWGFDYMPEGQNSVSYVLSAQAFHGDPMLSGQSFEAQPQDIPVGVGGGESNPGFQKPDE